MRKLHIEKIGSHESTNTVAARDTHFECSEDDVGLWEIIWFVERTFPATTDMEIKEAVLSNLLVLLKDGLVDPRIPVRDGTRCGFKSWDLPAFQHKV